MPTREQNVRRASPEYVALAARQTDLELLSSSDPPGVQVSARLCARPSAHASTERRAPC